VGFAKAFVFSFILLNSVATWVSAWSGLNRVGIVRYASTRLAHAVV